MVETTAKVPEFAALVGDAMAQVDTSLLQEMTPDIPQSEELAQYIKSNLGKRLRPLCTLLASGACGVGGTHQVVDERQIKLATAVELLHNATLLHDDVVDDAGMRRGLATPNALWSNAHSVLLGDYLYSRAFLLMADIGIIELFSLFARATHRIASGELHQLLRMREWVISEAEYREILRKKTGELFAASCAGGALVVQATDAQKHALDSYGMALGEAFQIIDDLLDYVGDSEKTGKVLGTDLREGKITLPLIRAMQQGGDEVRELLLTALKRGEDADLQAVIAAVRSTDALTYTEEIAHGLSYEAIEYLQTLEPSEYRDALEQLAHFAVGREF